MPKRVRRSEGNSTRRQYAAKVRFDYVEYPLGYYLTVEEAEIREDEFRIEFLTKRLQARREAFVRDHPNAPLSQPLVEDAATKNYVDNVAQVYR
jgi:hypothetical protein